LINDITDLELIKNYCSFIDTKLNNIILLMFLLYILYIFFRVSGFKTFYLALNNILFYFSGLIFGYISLLILIQKGIIDNIIMEKINFIIIMLILLLIGIFIIYNRKYIIEYE